MVRKIGALVAAVAAFASVASAEAQRCVDQWILVGLERPLAAAGPDGTHDLSTGRPALDHEIERNGVHRIDRVVRPEIGVDPARLAAHRLDRLYRFHVPPGADPVAVARRLSHASGVEYAEPDWIESVAGFERPQRFPSDLRFDEQWGLHQESDADVDAPEAWALTTGARKVIAVLDSGITPGHPDLQGKVLAGIDIVDGDADPTSEAAHGTWVASVAVARTDNFLGIAGACWSCVLLPVRTADSFLTTTISWFVNGMVWAVDNGADVINYSAGGPTHSQARLDAVRYAHEAGVFVVAAAGNGGGVGFPARYRETLAVGGTDPLDELTEFSSTGREMDVVAPAEAILVANPLGGFGLANGTSFATPLVAGLVALIDTIHPGVGREELKHIVQASAEDRVGDSTVDTEGWDPSHGFGRLNMYRALASARSIVGLHVDGKLETRVYHRLANVTADSYDFIRGDLHDLVRDGERIRVDSAICLENDSSDPDTAAGHEDTGLPAPDRGYYYLSRFTADGFPSSFGAGTGRIDRGFVAGPAPDRLLAGSDGAAGWGLGLAAAGDVNGDGFDDLILGAPGRATEGGGNGSVYLYYGGPEGVDPEPGWSFHSVVEDSMLGTSVAGAGDVNGDGFDDLIIGEPLFSGVLAERMGRALVFLGSAQGPRSVPDHYLRDPRPNARYGQAVAGIGDVNADGYDDVAAGAPRYGSPSNNEGRIAVFLGGANGLQAGPAWTFDSDQTGARLGVAISRGADFDGDGFSDFAAGAPRFSGGQSNEGRVFVFRGSATGLPATPSAILEVDAPDARFGMHVEVVGDVDGDGREDLAVSAPQIDGPTVREGAVFLFRGGGPDGVEPDPFDEHYTGLAHAQVHSVGGADVDGDGHADLLVGSSGLRITDVDEGMALLFRGSSGGFSDVPDWSESGRQVAALFGRRVAGLGDVNGDGYEDFAIAASGHDDSDYETGRVYIYLGRPDGPPTNPRHACD